MKGGVIISNNGDKLRFHKFTNAGQIPKDLYRMVKGFVQLLQEGESRQEAYLTIALYWRSKISQAVFEMFNAQMKHRRYGINLINYEETENE